MPPVASLGEQWREALDSALATNESRAGKPSSGRALAKALAAAHGSTQKEDSWKRALNKIRSGNGPTERQAKLIAAALGVERSTLPLSHQRPTLAAVAGELAAAMEHIARLEKRVESLEEPHSQREVVPTVNP